MGTGVWGRDSVRLSYRLKSERERQISYINELMWNQEKWYRQSYLQSRKRDTDRENKHMGIKGRGVGRTGRLGLTLTIDTRYKIDN